MVNRSEHDPVEFARAADEAIHDLCRVLRAETGLRPTMAPADVDQVLAHLAEAIAALPQATRQLSQILEQTARDHVLQMDEMADTHDPAVAIGSARLHLDASAASALSVRHSLDAAHQHTAHIASHGQRPDMWAVPTNLPQARRPEDRQAPAPNRDRPGPHR